MFIFKGKITEAEKQELKEHYGEIGLFLLKSKDGAHDNVFRPISAELWRDIQKLIEEKVQRNAVVPRNQIDELLFRNCLIWPAFTEDDISNMAIGAFMTAGKIIQERSGFSETTVDGVWVGPTEALIPLQDFKYWEQYSQEELDSIKKENPCALFKLRIGKWIFVIRQLTRADFQIASQDVDATLTTARRVCVWPREIDWLSIPAGILDKISACAMNISGWETDDVDIEEL